MKMKNKSNLAIIIGSDHHNTLGLIRSLGVNGVNPFLILVNPQGVNNYCAKSKYLEGVKIVRDDEEALAFLNDSFDGELHKPVIFPSSDGAEFLIDTHRDELAGKYILSGINEKQGAVAELMNKSSQANWAKSIGIKIADTQFVDIQQYNGGGYSHVS